MIQIQVDQELIIQMYQDAIDTKIEELDNAVVFWDSKELKRRTNLSWNTIQDNFFHDKDFPKMKIGGKWLYPAKEAEEFLLSWLKSRKCE